MCRVYNDQYAASFISVIPTTLYRPNDNYGVEQSHMMAALIRKLHTAKIDGKGQVTRWGGGSARRELMFVDDAADASFFLMQNYNSKEPVNIGVGEDLTIRELVELR